MGRSLKSLVRDGTSMGGAQWEVMADLRWWVILNECLMLWAGLGPPGADEELEQLRP